MERINKKFVDELFNPKESDIKIIKNDIEQKELLEINNFVKTKKDSFEVKREKYIQNNQLVSLIYRGPFDMDALNNTVFDKIVNKYKSIRNEINTFSEIPFTQGNSLEIKLIHYPISKLGVDIHKDLSSNLNLIVFFNLEGSTSIKTHSNKEGSETIEHPIKFGDISIMRGPRSKTEIDIRPYHSVQEVFEPRTVLVIREIDDNLEKITNKDNWRGF